MSIVIFIDQLAKTLARTFLEPGVHYHLLGNIFGLTLHQNNGVAFGFFSWLPQRISIPLFAVITLLAAIYIMFFYRSIPLDKTLPRISLMLILGGALGNLLDRILIGRVTDFLDIARFEPTYENIWPVFNLADFFIISGVITLFILLLLDRNFGKKTPSDKPVQLP